VKRLCRYTSGNPMLPIGHDATSGNPMLPIGHNATSGDPVLPIGQWDPGCGSSGHDFPFFPRRPFRATDSYLRTCKASVSGWYSMRCHSDGWAEPWGG
jgi:hypothetical protein